MSDALAEGQVRIHNLLEDGSLDSMAADVADGLTREPKQLSPKYLYDERGSELFELITTVPEYYPTRCERTILNRHAPAIAEMTGAEELVELGSGSASKTRALLSAMAGTGRLRRYVPFDVSESTVQRAAAELTEAYPGLSVHGVVGDFQRHLESIPAGDRRLVAFLGGTIGNLFPTERHAMLAALGDLLGVEDRLLVGMDLVKDPAILEAAYDDSRGATAEFNRNLLHSINRVLGANFEPERFDHVARFDREHSWVEMRLRATADMTISVPGAGVEVTFSAGEEMRTEISTKFTRAGIEADLGGAGMRLEELFTDPGGLFSVSLAAPATWRREPARAAGFV